MKVRVRDGYYSEQIRNESFGLILDNLAQEQKKVLDAIKLHQPCSTEDIAECLNKFPHTVTPRVLELRELGLVEFAGSKISPRSHRRVSLWRLKIESYQETLFP